MNRYPTVKCYDEAYSHIEDAVGADYVTLCGLDGDDPVVGQSTLEPSSTVTCPHCINIWLHCRTVPRRDLVE
jgi:hypothetical protein